MHYSKLYEIFPNEKAFSELYSQLLYTRSAPWFLGSFQMLKRAFWKKASWTLMHWAFLWEFILFLPLDLDAQPVVFRLQNKGLYQLSHLTHPLSDTLLPFTRLTTIS